MKNQPIKIGLLLYALFLTTICFSQTSSVNQSNPLSNNNGPRIGFNLAYDIPTYTYNYPMVDYKGGLNFGTFFNYYFNNNIGFGIDYNFIKNSPTSLLPDSIYYGPMPSATTITKKGITRQFVGAGPLYKLGFFNGRMDIEFGVKAGIGIISGGDILVTALNPGGGTDNHLVQTGFKDLVFTGKAQLKTTVFLTQSLGFNFGAYYMRHYGCSADDQLDLPGVGSSSVIYGQSDFDLGANREHIVSNRDALTINEGHCGNISSIGAFAGITYRFGPSKVKEPCNNCGCPDDGHRVVVTVEDGPSSKKIANADVAIKNLDGDIIATGTTNSFGVVDFGQILHNNYSIEGNVYGVATTLATITDNEFVPDAVIQKKLLYEDLRFILKGKTINKQSRNPEPNVVVSLTNIQTKSVKQDNSNGTGDFSFHLDKNSSYELVGIKENRLSDIDRASTIGLTRSTTLFVELELGLDNFDCGMGTILDIKYDYDKWDILQESKFELDRLVRYMMDHGVSRVELSSHTDSRGSNDYNLSLSDKRANSAADYIGSRGISRSRIIAQGYGENRLKNHCSDGINCSETDHRINRRTEAKLLCN